MGLSSEIAEAWALRMALRVEDSRLAVARIRARGSVDRQDEYELDLLDASLARADGDLAKSREILRTCRERQLAESLDPSFHWDFQSANNLYLESRFAEALEFFLRARGRARNTFETAIAVGSALLCTEALGLPFAALERELAPLKGAFEDPSLRASFDDQLDALRLREAHRTGDVQALWSHARVTGATLRSQVDWFRAWVARLPYLEAPARERERRIDEFDPELHAFQHRMGTLSLKPSHGTIATSAQKIERIYLWTTLFAYRWATGDGPRISPEDIEIALADLTLSEIRDRTSMGSLLYLCLGLRWLGLTSPTLRAGVERFLASHEPDDSAWPEALRLERDLLRALGLSDRARISRLTTVCSSPLWTAPGYRWPKILAAFESKISEAATTSTHKVRLGLEADPRTGRLRSADGETISLPVARFLEALRLNGGSLEFSAVLEAAYGIGPYDEDQHLPKIHNLMARTRKVLPPPLKLISRESRAHLLNDDPRRLRFRASEREPRAPDWLKTRAAPQASHLDRWIRPRAVLEKAPSRENLTRRQMELIMGCSKATANRLLNRWETEGLVSRRGRGRTARYRIELAGP